MKFLRDAPRWLLLAALVYAPWDYGGTTERGVVRLNWILGLAVSLWFIGWIGRRIFAQPSAELDDNGPSRAPRILWAVSILLLLVGWWMVANAKAIYDSDYYLFVGVTRLLPWAPGSVDQAVSYAWMIRATTLIGTICLVADVFRDPKWLLRLWTTLAVTGGSIAFLGLIQKASGAPMIFWKAIDRPVTTFFATFYYHGNAGAFLNLTLPLTIGLAVRSFTRPGQPIVRALWLVLALVSVVAIFANTSRMGQVLGAAIVISLTVGFGPTLFGAARRRRFEWRMALVGGVIILGALFAIIKTSRVDRSLQRWERISETVPRDARWLATEAAVRALPEASWLGFGPGTFHIVFPYFTGGLDARLRGEWIHLHEDYLQTLIEWGWFGGALWAGLFFGGIAVAVRSRISARAQTWTPRQRFLLPLVLVGLASVLLHALVDFPLQIASIQLYVATYLGICWGSSRWSELGSLRPPERADSTP